MAIWARIQQPFCNMFSSIVLISFNINKHMEVAQLLIGLNEWFSQSNFVLLLNLQKFGEKNKNVVENSW